MNGATVLVIEDERDILEVIRANLAREGYKVLEATDGEEGLRSAFDHGPDLVVLDIMLPSVDGIEVCRQLKSDPVTSQIPVIMVTARSDDTDVVLGLMTGADDYLTKPFSPKELVARVRAVLRRGRPALPDAGHSRVVRKGLTVDPDRHEVKVDGVSVALTATEFRLLHFLSTNPGRVFSREQLLHRAIGSDAVVIKRNIDVHIRGIRKKLGDYAEFVETIRGVGYRFRDNGHA
jgi:DNA-binding response OmpR family regulator